MINLPCQADVLGTRDDIFLQVLNSLDALVCAVDMKTHEIFFINSYGKNIWGETEGTICWPDGRMVRLEVATDITGRKQAEQTLMENETLYRSASALMRAITDSALEPSS